MIRDDLMALEERVDDLLRSRPDSVTLQRHGIEIHGKLRRTLDAINTAGPEEQAECKPILARVARRVMNEIFRIEEG